MATQRIAHDNATHRSFYTSGTQQIRSRMWTTTREVVVMATRPRGALLSRGERRRNGKWESENFLEGMKLEFYRQNARHKDAYWKYIFEKSSEIRQEKPFQLLNEKIENISNANMKIEISK